MKVRPASYFEAPLIARIGTLSFAKDPSYGHFYPWRALFPQDFYQHLLYKYKRIMLTPGELIVVVELDEEDKAESEEIQKRDAGKIVGFATFRRSGGTQAERDRWSADSISKKIGRLFLTISETIWSFLRPNRAVCQQALDKFWKQAFDTHATTKFTGKLDFMTLAVLPEYQRRGIGERLMDFAGYKGFKEGIPVFGDATEKGLPLYVKLGGKHIGSVVMEETTYEKPGGKLPITEPLLRTPVLRWDAENVERVRMEMAGHGA